MPADISAAESEAWCEDDDLFFARELFELLANLFFVGEEAFGLGGTVESSEDSPPQDEEDEEASF